MEILFAIIVRVAGFLAEIAQGVVGAFGGGNGDPRPTEKPTSEGDET